MGTRSRIGVMHGDVCKSVYCHWDGYLEHNGRILMAHYDSAKANQLVALGDISSLGSEIGEKHDFDVRFTEGAIGENWTKFYGRDRGETGTEYKVDHTFEDFIKRCDGCDAEYFYLMKDGVWYTGSPESNTLVRLDEAMASLPVEE